MNTVKTENKIKLFFRMFWSADEEYEEIKNIEEIESINSEDKKTIETLRKSDNGYLKKLAKEYDIVPMEKIPRVKNAKFKKAEIKGNEKEILQNEKQLLDDEKER